MNKTPDVVIQMTVEGTNSVFRNPKFTPPDAPAAQSDPAATEVHVPESSVKFYPASTKGD